MRKAVDGPKAENEKNPHTSNENKKKKSNSRARTRRLVVQ